MYLKTVAAVHSETHLELSGIVNTSNRIRSTNNFREISKTLFSIKYLQYPLAEFEHGTMFPNDAVFCFLTYTTLQRNYSGRTKKGFKILVELSVLGYLELKINLYFDQKPNKLVFNIQEFFLI